uniref:Uncharacterized protein n=1 Tax=Myripristis murdjan TaxID=586833 RepID=A0A667YQH1_9TELE
CKRHQDHPRHTLQWDRLVPGVGELCGGSLREERAGSAEGQASAVRPTYTPGFE